MKILFLNQAFYPDVVSSAQHLSDLAVALANRGHQVCVLTSRRAYDAPETIFERKETWRGVQVIRVGSTAFGKGGKWRRIVDSLSFLLLACVKACTLRRSDVVVALTSPPLIGLLGLCVARLHGSRFVNWTLDLNPDEAVATGWLRADSFITKFLHVISKLVLRGADLVIVLDRFMRTRVLQKGVDPSAIVLLPPWSHQPEVRFDPAGRRRFRSQYRLRGKFVVMYSGNHSPCHPLKTVLEAARQLAADSQVVFCFVGGGSEFRKIQQLINKSDSDSASGPSRGASNIICIPYRPRSELAASLSAADLHLIVMGDRLVGIVHPCKIYNVLTVGSPVIYIGPTPSSISEILASRADPQLPWGSVGQGDVTGLIAQIQRIRRVSQRRSLESALANTEAFSARSVVPKFVARLEALLCCKATSTCLESAQG